MLGSKKILFTKRLLKWSKENRVRHPWRESSDPFKVLLAEILLRKTTRKQVHNIFDLFIRKFPNPDALAKARMREIESEIEPLGMQHVRARKLKELAEVLMSQFKGKVPLERDHLLDLPGVGEYIANATLCFCLNRDIPLVDTNVQRVLERVFSLKTEKAEARKDIRFWKLANDLIPRGKGREFNLALIDFANEICTKRNPRCSECLMNDICDYGKKRLANIFRRKK